MLVAIGGLVFFYYLDNKFVYLSSIKYAFIFSKLLFEIRFYITIYSFICFDNTLLRLLLFF